MKQNKTLGEMYQGHRIQDRWPKISCISVHKQWMTQKSN